MSIDSKLLSLVDANINGILWLTKESVSHETTIHETLDYLVDGKLYQFLNKMNLKEPGFDNEDFNFFISQSFNKPFFLIHKKGSFNSKKDLKPIKLMLESNTDAKELSLLILSDDQKDLVSSFEKNGIKAKFYTPKE